MANPKSNNVSGLPGNADGTFQSAVNYLVGTTPRVVASADLNGDARDDSIVTGLGNPIPIVVLLNAGFSISPALSNRAVVLGQNASFSITASVLGPFSCQWRRNDAVLVNGGPCSGATTATLQISNITAAENGAYDVSASYSCLRLQGNPAALNVSAVCRGDFTNDGQFDGLDVPNLVNALLAGQSCPQKNLARLHLPMGNEDDHA